jgi:signal peptidase I
MVLRVVAMPGQTIWSYGKQIFINGSVLRESAWYNHKYGQVGSAQVPFTTVPAGSYYLMGDNRSQSCDSRAFGAVPGSAIVGKVVTVLLRAGHPYIHPF